MSKQTSEEKQLILTAIEKQKAKYQAEQEYNEAREDLKQYMIDNDKDRLTTPWYIISLKKSPRIMEDKMMDEYPEIYYEGLECVFRKRKANKMFDPLLVDRVVEECKQGDDLYVQIQTNPKGRKTKKT